MQRELYINLLQGEQMLEGEGHCTIVVSTPPILGEVRLVQYSFRRNEDSQ